MRRTGIATRLFVLQVVGVLVLAALAGAWQWTSARDETERAAAARCTALATSVADNPFVLEALASDDPSRSLQPYALDLMRDTDTDFVTVMAPDRTRFTHPDPAEIGRPFIGTVAPALAGRSFTETYAGTLGPSVRAVVPVLGDDGSVVALVAAGVTVDSVSAALGQRLPLLVGGALATVALGALAAWLLSRHLRRVRDHAELRQLTDELRTMSTLSEALRSQTHEFANRLHTIVALIELGRTDEALRFASDELDLGQVLADEVVAAVDEPVLAALLLGKSAQARERAVELELRVSPDFGTPGMPVRDLVTVIGNLVDNALDAAAPRWAGAAVQVGAEIEVEAGLTANRVPDHEPGKNAVHGPERSSSAPHRVQVRLERPAPGTVRVAVSDTGPGLPEGRDVFLRGVSTKPAGAEGRGIGLALVAQVARRAGGTVDARSTEHGTTITVDLPDQEAVVRS